MLPDNIRLSQEPCTTAGPAQIGPGPSARRAKPPVKGFCFRIVVAVRIAGEFERGSGDDIGGRARYFNLRLGR